MRIDRVHAGRDDVVVRDRFKQGLGVHDDCSHELSVSLPRENVVNAFFASPVEGICDIRLLGVLKNVFTSARPWLVAKASSRSPLSLSMSRP